MVFSVTNDGTAKHPKEKRKKRLDRTAFSAFLLSLSAAGWFLIALLGDLMNPRLLSISFVSFVPPITLSLSMYAICKYVQKKADAIVTETEEDEEQRRRDIVAAITRATQPASARKPSGT
jgi:hypothetical protein